ncbi:MAG: hypothetical protein M3069_28900 [Chloroflexota bacterium]|nr:hypothetical protein [Chloroflexota bacterium]
MRSRFQAIKNVDSPVLLPVQIPRERFGPVRWSPRLLQAPASSTQQRAALVLSLDNRLEALHAPPASVDLAVPQHFVSRLSGGGGQPGGQHAVCQQLSNAQVAREIVF